jgi:hypothetical protein
MKWSSQEKNALKIKKIKNNFTTKKNLLASKKVSDLKYNIKSKQ